MCTEVAKFEKILLLFDMNLFKVRLRQQVVTMAWHCTQSYVVMQG